MKLWTESHPPRAENWNYSTFFVDGEDQVYEFEMQSCLDKIHPDDIQKYNLVGELLCIYKNATYLEMRPLVIAEDGKLSFSSSTPRSIYHWWSRCKMEGDQMTLKTYRLDGYYRYEIAPLYPDDRPLTLPASLKQKEDEVSKLLRSADFKVGAPDKLTPSLWKHYSIFMDRSGDCHASKKESFGKDAVREIICLSPSTQMRPIYMSKEAVDWEGTPLADLQWTVVRGRNKDGTPTEMGWYYVKGETCLPTLQWKQMCQEKGVPDIWQQPIGDGQFYKFHIRPDKVPSMLQTGTVKEWLPERRRQLEKEREAAQQAYILKKEMARMTEGINYPKEQDVFPDTIPSLFWFKQWYGIPYIHPDPQTKLR